MRELIRNFLRRRPYALLNLRLAQSTNVLPPGHLMSLFRVLGVNRVVGVGANRGDYGAKLRDFGHTGRIVSFKPIYEGAPHCLEPLAEYEAYDFHLTGQFNVVGEQRTIHVIEMDAVLSR